MTKICDCKLSNVVDDKWFENKSKPQEKSASEWVYMGTYINKSSKKRRPFMSAAFGSRSEAVTWAEKECKNATVTHIMGVNDDGTLHMEIFIPEIKDGYYAVKTGNFIGVMRRFHGQWWWGNTFANQSSTLCGEEQPTIVTKLDDGLFKDPA